MSQEERLPPPDPASLDEAQREAAARFAERRGTAPFGPFATLLHSPELCLAAEAMGRYLRYGSALPLRISELVILVTAAEWDQLVEWRIHHPIALEAGISPAAAEAIATKATPAALNEDEALAYTFALSLHRTRDVPDDVYERALAMFGPRGVVDLAGICGYYGFLAAVMNTARTA